MSNQCHSSVSLYTIDNPIPHHCGYCDTKGSVSSGMTAEKMTIQDYQSLIDRGWRRSGTYLYKPKMDRTCCPLYTIKCDSKNFQLRKSQKNTLKLIKNFLEQNKRKTCTKNSEATQQGSSPLKFSNDNIQNRINQTENTNAKKIMDFFLKSNLNLTEIEANKPEDVLGVKKLKAKHVRLYKKILKLKKKNQINNQLDILKNLKRNPSQHEQDCIEKYLSIPSSVQNKLELRLVRSFPPSREFKESLDEEHKIYTKYQTKIHQDKPSECSMSQFKRFLCDSPLLADSYKGPLTNSDLSKLSNEKHFRNDIAGDVSSIGYGSFHQQFILNGKIIGVGVIDILNNCVSSVYFFYDPDYHFLNLGTYSALREIALVRQINKLDNDIKWYYLGFYVHTCIKMRYKAFYYPSYLLCPEVYTWHPIEECIKILNTSKYSRFAPREKGNHTITEDQDQIENVENVKIKFSVRGHSRMINFQEFCNFLNPNYIPEFTNLVLNYCKLFGKTVSERIVINFD
ncbi:arginyl-tRNA-- transferase 1-like isoform X2 [Brachionus plicatilis]|uniref:Arginyl-tRNA--protein transferase 1 n=1 Tax=Brachionus plicatilis TaxID=10195 RepID=A0A3M7RIU4_BRAPC|nr:arginyl-tRNA-- transferase 1-like isoform X2 [Brachionus plicatilis]